MLGSLLGGLYSNYYLNFAPANDQNTYFSGLTKSARRSSRTPKSGDGGGSLLKMCRIEYVDKENRGRTTSNFDTDDFDIRRRPTFSKKSENKRELKTNEAISLVSLSERNALSENHFGEKVLAIEKKSIDRCLEINLMGIRREKEFLTKKYLDYQANNHSLLKQRKEQIKKRNSVINFELQQQMSTETLNMTNSSFNLKYSQPIKLTSSSAVNFDTARTADFEESLVEFENKHSLYIKSVLSRMFTTRPEPFDEFKLDQIDLIGRFESVYETSYEQLPERLKIKTPTEYTSFIDSIKNKFVEQKLTMFPNYLKPTKRPNKMTKSLLAFDLEFG
jgi:hypothetical protein